MKRVLIGLLCLGLSACDKGTTTLPDPVDVVATPAPVSVTPTVVGDPKPVDSPAPTDGKIDIDDAGTVTWNKPFTATACVYTYQEFPNQTFSHSYQVSNGSTLQPNPAWPCGTTITMQLDLQRGPVCPKDPFANQWDGFLRGRAKVTYTTAVCPTPQPTPKPTPSPTPPPCENQPTYRTEIVKQYENAENKCGKVTIWTIVYETNSCTGKEIEISRKPSDGEYIECPLPPGCYYNYSKNVVVDKCTAIGGTDISWNANNHLCSVPFPGTENQCFNLNQGKSMDGCKKYNGKNSDCK